MLMSVEPRRHGRCCCRCCCCATLKQTAQRVFLIGKILGQRKICIWPYELLTDPGLWVACPTISRERPLTGCFVNPAHKPNSFPSTLFPPCLCTGYPSTQLFPSHVLLPVLQSLRRGHSTRYDAAASTRNPRGCPPHPHPTHSPSLFQPPCIVTSVVIPHISS